MAKKFITNFVGGVAKADISKLNLSRTVNMLPEITDDGSTVTTILRSFPGMQTQWQSLGGDCRGLLHSEKYGFIGVFGNRVQKMTSSSRTQIGTLTTSTGRVRIIETGGENPHIVVCDGAALYHYYANVDLGAYDSTKKYYAGDYCTKGNYKALCIATTHMAVTGEWDSTKWSVVSSMPGYSWSQIELPTGVVPADIALFYNFILMLEKDTDKIFISYQYPWEDLTAVEAYNSERQDIFMLHFKVKEFNEDGTSYGTWPTVAHPDFEDFTTSAQVTNYNVKVGGVTYAYTGEYFTNWHAFDIDHSVPEAKCKFTGQVWVNLFPQGHYFMAEYMPDPATAICSCNGSLYTIGTNSCQVFSYNASADYLAGGYCFSSQDTSGALIGGIGDTFANLGSSVFFVGCGDKGTNGIFKFGTAGATRISNHSIERKTLGLTPIRGYCISYLGHILYVVDYTNFTIAYDESTNIWIELSSIVNDVDTAWRYHYSCNYDNKTWLGTNGKVVTLTEDKYTEHDNNPIKRLRAGNMISADGQEIQIDQVDILLNNGQEEIYAGAGNLTVSFKTSRDGGSWEEARVVDCGDVGDYSHSVLLYDIGTGRNFTFEISSTSNYPFALYGIVADVEVCDV